MKQSTSNILMIQPVSFSKNAQTAVNNYYQKDSVLSPEQTQEEALKEFNTFVSKLKAKGIQVHVIQDTKTPETPDSIFPNNWISFHQDARVGIYPMFAKNRRDEVRLDILDYFKDQGFDIDSVVDYRDFDGEILEGTGSLILDRQNMVAYCALSPRADQKLFEKYCLDFGYKPIVFHAYQSVDNKRELIYHTNVMMCMADRYVVICLDTVDDREERDMLLAQFKENGKEVVEISEDQVNQFAGNMLQVENTEGKQFLIMSQSAKDSLNELQLESLLKYNEIISSELDTIETCGGGSARCMMAEVFLPKKF